MNVLAVLLVCRFLFFCTLLLGLFFLSDSQRKHHQAQAQLQMRAVSYMMRTPQLVPSWPWTSQVWVSILHFSLVLMRFRSRIGTSSIGRFEETLENCGSRLSGVTLPFFHNLLNPIHGCLTSRSQRFLRTGDCENLLQG